MSDYLDDLLDRMAFADVIRRCCGEDVTADEVEHMFARHEALRVTEDDAPVAETRCLQ